MKLIAKKPCSFRGEKFYIGDEIPSEFVLSPRDQEKMGVLAIVKDSQDDPEIQIVEREVVKTMDTVEILIHAEEGDLPLNVSKEGLQAVVDILTSKADDAEPIIREMTDNDALILLHIADGRKAVKTAAEARAKAINESEPEDAGEEAGEQ